jgi:hypothetical protein
MAFGFVGGAAETSTLKVAICDPGPDPYSIRLDNGSLVGFDRGTQHTVTRF